MKSLKAVEKSTRGAVAVDERRRIAVVPFSDARGRVFLPRINSPWEIIEDPAFGPVDPARADSPLILNAQLELARPDFVITGEVRSLGQKGLEATAFAVETATGKTVARGDLKIKAAPKKRVLSAAERSCFQMASVSLSDPLFVQPNFRGACQLAGCLAFFDISIGPPEGWGDVFVRTLGGALGALFSGPDEFPIGDGGVPPVIYGEVIDGCRVILQTRRGGHQEGWGGWYTFIPEANPERLGFHIEPTDLRRLSDDSLIFTRGKTMAHIFKDKSDLGFKELWSHGIIDEEWDSQKTSLSPEVIYKIAKAIRTLAWKYAAIGKRPYEKFGWFSPNGNSFLGEMKRGAEIASGSSISIPDTQPDEGDHNGWDYWPRKAKNWESEPS